jgi:large subunit ribosomal protein L25
MEELKLKSTIRTETGKKVKKLRRNALIPAVIYGHKVKSQSLKVGYKDFENVYKKAGENTLISLLIGDNSQKVIVHDLQIDPITERFLHIDFYQVKMDEKISAEVPLIFVGESEAVKNEGGVFVKNMDTIEIESLPQDLPKEIKVDISQIKNLEEAIHAKDLDIPKNVKLSVNEDEVVAIVLKPRTKEELEATQEKVEEKVEDVEGVKDKEAKGEAKEEGKEKGKQEEKKEEGKKD